MTSSEMCSSSWKSPKAAEAMNASQWEKPQKASRQTYVKLKVRGISQANEPIAMEAVVVAAAEKEKELAHKRISEPTKMENAFFKSL